jgi:hypothetical protein
LPTPAPGDALPETEITMTTDFTVLNSTSDGLTQ